MEAAPGKLATATFLRSLGPSLARGLVQIERPRPRRGDNPNRCSITPFKVVLKPRARHPRLYLALGPCVDLMPRRSFVEEIGEPTLGAWCGVGVWIKGDGDHPVPLLPAVAGSTQAAHWGNHVRPELLAMSFRLRNARPGVESLRRRREGHLPRVFAPERCRSAAYTAPRMPSVFHHFTDYEAGALGSEPTSPCRYTCAKPRIH